MVAALNGRFRSTTVSVNPGYVTKWLFLIAVFHVDFTGESMPHVDISQDLFSFVFPYDHRNL